MKTARKTAANTVVASWWETATTAFERVPPVAAAADDPEAAEADVALAVAEVDDEAEEPPELPSTAVALRVPHFWFFLQVSCPCASLGFAAIHCT